MIIKTKYIGDSIVEMHVSIGEMSAYTDLCDLNGLIDKDFIRSLRDLANELEDHNECRLKQIES